MSEAQRRAFGGDGIFVLSPPNDRNQRRGQHSLQKRATLIPRPLDFLVMPRLLV